MTMSRLYTPPAMSREDWLAIPPVEMSIKSPTCSQAFLSVQIMWDLGLGRYKQAYGGDEYLHVVRENGVYWIHDGHHRYIFAFLRGDQTIMARIVDNDNGPVPFRQVK
jgi:hypothetical protein